MRPFNRTLASARSSVAFRETVSLALDSFCASKTRFLLTMLGMVIGSASIILVATLGLTGRQYALNMIASIGPNMIEMQYVGGSVAGPDNTTVQDSMTSEDLIAVLEQVPGITASSPMLEYHDRISMGNGLTKDTMFLGVSPQYKEVRNLKVLAGRFFDDQDANTHAKVAVLIGPLAEALYGSYGAAIDQKISVKGIPFTVIGVFKEGVETFGQSEVNDQTILIPYPVARYFTGTNTVKQIFFSVAESATGRTCRSPHSGRHPLAAPVYQRLQRLHADGGAARDGSDRHDAHDRAHAGFGHYADRLRRRHHELHAGQCEARIKEIGIRKALGATRREIRMQFLTESVFMSLSGGLVGTIIGLALPLSLRMFSNIKIPVSAWSAVIALATSVLVGVAFGTLPAQRAARLDPVATLKYE